MVIPFFYDLLVRNFYDDKMFFNCCLTVIFSRKVFLASLEYASQKQFLTRVQLSCLFSRCDTPKSSFCLL